MLPADIPGLLIGELLGQGGFATVHVARRKSDGREVAVKIALRKRDARFEREVAALRRVGRDVGPELLGAGALGDGRPYIVMELVRGEPLSRWIGERRTKPLEERVRLVATLARVVDAMHTRGVFHRDLKPENVLVRAPLDLQAPSVCLVDFGLARPFAIADQAESKSPEVELTAEGAQVGTISYMAPEQCEGRRVDARTDIYALGVILFEALVGKPPFEGDRAQVAAAHASRRPPTPSRVAGTPPAFDAIVARCLEKRAEDRYARALEVAEAIERAQQRTPSVAPQANAMPLMSVAVQNGSMRGPTALLVLRTTLTEQQALEALAAPQVKLVRRLEDGCLFAFADPTNTAQGVMMALQAAARVIDRAAEAVLHVATIGMRESRRGTMFVGQEVDAVDAWAPRRGLPGLVLTPSALAAIQGASSVERAPDPPAMRPNRRPSTELSSARAADSSEGSGLPAELMPAPPFADRDELLLAMEAEIQRTQTLAAPTLVTVTGEVGMGKTRLVDELVARYSNRFRALCRLRGSSPQEGHVVELGRRLARFVFGLSEDCSVEQVRAACGARLGEPMATSSWASVAHALGILSDDAADLARLRGTPGAIRRTLARALGLGLAMLAAEQSTCVIVDDAHWADAATLDALEIASLADSRGALLLVVVAHPSLVQQRSGWAERAGRSVRHILGPLSPTEADRVIRALFVPVDLLPDPVVARLRNLTAGVPLQLVEAAHTLWLAGKVRKRRETGGHYLAADDLLEMSTTPLAERLARRILNELPEPLAEILRIACILGTDVDRRDVAALQAVVDTKDSLDPGVGLQRLAERGLLVAVNKSLFRFEHGTMRDALEALMAPPARQALHEAALQCLRERSDERPYLLARLARHAAACGARGQAAAAYLELAETATRDHAPVDAETFATQALLYLDEQQTMPRERALSIRSDARTFLERYEDAQADLFAANALAEARGDTRTQAELLLHEAMIADLRHDHATSAAAVERATPLVNVLNETLLVARLLTARGRTHWRQGRTSEAIPDLEQGAEMAAQQGDSRTQAIALLMLAPALVATDRIDDAAKRFESLIALCERTGDRYHLATSHINRIWLWIKRQDYERAVHDQRVAMTVARELGNATLEAYATGNVAELLYFCGNYDEALGMARRMDMLLRRQHTRPQPEATVIRARIEALVGEREQAKRLMCETIESLGKDVPPIVQTMSDMIDLLLADPAHDEPATWNELIERLGGCAETDEGIDALYHAAQRAGRMGRKEQAATYIARAREQGRGPMWEKRFAALEASIVE